MKLSIEKGKDIKPLDVKLSHLATRDEIKGFVKDFLSTRDDYFNYRNKNIDLFVNIGYLFFWLVVFFLVMLIISASELEVILGIASILPPKLAFRGTTVSAVALLLSIGIPILKNRVYLSKLVEKVNKEEYLYGKFFTREYVTHISYKYGDSVDIESNHVSIKTLEILSRIEEPANIYVSDTDLRGIFENTDGYDIIEDAVVEYKGKYYLLGFSPKGSVKINQYEFVEITHIFDNKHYTLQS